MIVFNEFNTSITGCTKNATSEFPKNSIWQFLSIKDFRPLALGIEIELQIDHIIVVVLLNKSQILLYALVCAVISTVVLF